MTVLVEFPSIVKHYAPYFKSCFSEEGYIHFQKALSGFMVSDNKTLEAINRIFLNAPCDPSNFNRFFHQPNLDLDELNQKRLDMLQQQEGTRFKTERSSKGVLMVDNTLLKHYGKQFDDIYYHYDYVNKCNRWAHDLVTLHYSDAKTDYPVYYQLWEPPDWEAVAEFLKAKDFTINQDKWDNRHKEVKQWLNYIRSRYRLGRKKHPEVVSVYKTKLHIAEQLIRKFCGQYPTYDFPIALDSGYTSAELCEIISKDLKKNYIGALVEKQSIIKGEQTIPLKDFVKTLREEHKNTPDKSRIRKTSFMYKGEKKVAYTYFATHKIKGFEHKQRLVISFLKKDLSDCPKFTITNRLNWYPSGILRIRRHRWTVETYHQEGKDEGLEKYQVRNYKAIQTYIALVVLTFCLLKSTLHNDALLSSIQQRLQTETDGTLPFLRRLMKAEGLMLLVKDLLKKIEQGEVPDQVIQPLIQTIAYS